MANKPLDPNRVATAVAAWLDGLSPDVRPRIEGLRALVREALPTAIEDYKWNSSSFVYNGLHVVTLNARGPKGTVLLVLHRGTQAKPEPTIVLADPEGLLKWHSPDRASLAFASLAEMDLRRNAVSALLQGWATQA
jgi:hypothetical protein